MAKYTAKCLASTYVSGFHNVEAVMAMPYRAFGNTGRVVSAFSYGASALGGVFTDGAVDEAEASQVVQYIIKNGVNLIDTAPWYGFGKAEAVLGKALKGIPRDAYYLHTKVGRYEADILKRFDFSYERTLRSIDESLERLGVRYIDTVQGRLLPSKPSESQYHSMQYAIGDQTGRGARRRCCWHHIFDSVMYPMLSCSA